MTESVEKLREKIAKVFRCERECNIYPSLCRKLHCKLKAEERDYEFTDTIMLLVLSHLPALAKERGWVKLPEPNPDDTIEDGFGSIWSAWCPMCHQKSMVVVRPGKARCNNCG